MHYLIFDTSNILFRTFHASRDISEQTIALAHHKSLRSFNKYVKDIKPDKVVAAFDKPNNWRKEYTRSDQCVSKLTYKGHRRTNMSPKQKQAFEMFIKSIEEFENLVREQTTMISLACEGLEADDLIAGFVRTHPDDQHTIVSGDTDFLQLLRQPGVTLLDPDSGKPRTLEKWDGDADLFMFEKCFRGDTSDNVQSAYPRIRRTRILECYTDEFKRANLLNETWTLLDREIRVGDMFEENKLLMDLTAQPLEIQEKIVNTIADEIGRKKKFNYFAFLRFCGQYELKNIAKDMEQFVGMFSK